MNIDKRLRCCCFTGHRPDKLTYGECEIKSLLSKAIDEATKNGYVTFITGMAQGTDIWAAEVILDKKKQNQNLRLVCAIPHPDFEKRRDAYERERYIRIIKGADIVKLVNQKYFRYCYQKRNEFMVDCSSLLIAVWNGSPSGTKNTIDYARKNGVNVFNVLEKRNFIKL